MCPTKVPEKFEYIPVIQLYPFHAVKMQDSQYYCHQEYNSTAHTYTDIKYTGRSGGSCVYRINWKRKVKVTEPFSKTNKQKKHHKNHFVSSSRLTLQEGSVAVPRLTPSALPPTPIRS